MGKRYRIAIIGASGYTGGELIRLLQLHPELEIVYCYSTNYAGQPVTAVHPDVLPVSQITFTDTFHTDVDGIFLAVSHGAAREFLAAHAIPETIPIVDLSRDFRLARDEFVYGLPEAFRTEIGQSRRVANPGCFATAIQLALLPLAKEGLLRSTVHIHAVTGSTGAGKALSETTHFTWRYSNVSIYKPFDHPHLPEIEATLGMLQSTPVPELNFIPMRGNFTRGIYATVYMEKPAPLATVQKVFRSYYQSEPFVFLLDTLPSVKQVVNTNYAVLYLTEVKNKLLIVSAIDNLLKGASGQALQNMNIMLGLPETAGLELKSIGY